MVLYGKNRNKYHFITGNGDHPMFDMTWRYARYDEGEPHVLYAFNNIILVIDDDEKSLFHMTEDSVAKMMQSGLYRFWLFGHVFILRSYHLLLTLMALIPFNMGQIAF